MTPTVAGRRLLVVEDDFFIAEDLARSFRAGGAEVIGPVARVDAALDLLGKAAPLDGAVVDINLQGEMAFPIADALLARGVSLVFTTGYDQANIPDRYHSVPCCEKPVDIVKIARKLFR